MFMECSSMRGIFPVLCGLLVGGPSVALAQGFDPGRVDILTLRLGMSRAEAMSGLLAQGIAATEIKQFLGSCQDDASRPCTVRIVARTKDGELTISFGDRVQGIAYQLNGKAVGEPQMIRGAVLERFGRPTTDDPMTWCNPPNGSALCQADRPRLIYKTAPKGGGTLSLLAGSPIAGSVAAGDATR